MSNFGCDPVVVNKRKAPPVQMAGPKGIFIMTNYNVPDEELQEDREEPEYGFRKKSNWFEVETVGFCEMCNKRISTPDDVYINKFNLFCSQACSDRLDEMESEANEQN